MKSSNDRASARRKAMKLVYFGRDRRSMEEACIEFWKNASADAKHQAMKEFVADELERLGLKEHGPKLLRLTSTFRKA